MTPERAHEFPLWPDEPPLAYPQPRPEEIEERPPRAERPGPNRAITHVSAPTLALQRAERPNGVTVVICPGGGFRYLEIDKEGHAIAQALAALGFSSLVLKYRTRPEGPADATRSRMDPQVRLAIIEDARQALRLTRERAQEWGLDPDRIGVMGFSAGGVLAAALAVSGGGDASEGEAGATVSARPDFAAPIYPGMPDELLAQVTSAAAPVFMAVADDDRQTPAENCLRFYGALREAGVPAELHILARGRHGFGLGSPGSAAALWPELFAAWLRDLGILQS